MNLNKFDGVTSQKVLVTLSVETGFCKNCLITVRDDGLFEALPATETYLIHVKKLAFQISCEYSAIFT